MSADKSNGLYAICDQEGRLLHSIIFAHAPTARAYFEEDADEHWRRMVETEAEVPTIEWLEIEPPTWADNSLPAWAGYTDDGVNPVVIAGVTVESRALVK